MESLLHYLPIQVTITIQLIILTGVIIVCFYLGQLYHDWSFFNISKLPLNTFGNPLGNIQEMMSEAMGNFNSIMIQPQPKSEKLEAPKLTEITEDSDPELNELISYEPSTSNTPSLNNIFDPDSINQMMGEMIGKLPDTIDQLQSTVDTLGSIFKKEN